jgi:hypothetical protein
MIRHILLAALSIFTVVATARADGPRNPLGETASYQLDKAAARTSSLIQSGSGVAKVTDFLPDDEQGPSYNVSLDYDFVVQFYGRQKGTTKTAFSEEFFTPEFMVKLRRVGSIETPDYKIKHEGFADARNMDGGVYPHCDKVLIYDIKMNELNPFAQLLYAAAGLDPSRGDNPQIENLKLAAHVFQSVPVLGAVKLDLSGIVQGMNVKAGFDFKR